MSSEFTEKEVRHVARLARLKCSDEEIATFTRQLGAILEYIGQLQQLDTDGIEPLTHCLAVHNVFRDDVVRPSLSNDAALANAPQRDGEFFALPRVLGNTGA